ncbi:MAG: TlpA family protein disulfide reductase [Pirellulales bacterium]|nr:TlpA family protein disulfide reductase [Pirellulales bacterium]
MSECFRKAAWLTVLAAAALVGCRQEEPQVNPQPAPVAAPEPEESPPEEMAAAEKEASNHPAPPPKIPDVAMTQTMAATNVVGVGDAMPEGQLPDPEGKTHTLKELYAPKLTVVLFWTSENLYALQELQDLQIDVVERYKDEGVQVIGVNVRDAAPVVKEKVEQAGAAYAQLLDADGAYYAKIATEHLPRTYLLNAEGKILWFDLEYSTSTGRNLEQAIKVALTQAGGNPDPASAGPRAGAAAPK